MCEVIGVDLYNQSVTGKVAKTLNSIKSDADHVPCVITNAKSLEVFHCTVEIGGGGTTLEGKRLQRPFGGDL